MQYVKIGKWVATFLGNKGKILRRREGNILVEEGFTLLV
jgi:hypothetical protein